MTTIEKIEEIVNEIESNYTPTDLQRITGDLSILNHLPDDIAVLLNGDKDHDVCVGNVRNLYMVVRDAEDPEKEKFYTKLCELRDALKIAFAALSK